MGQLRTVELRLQTVLTDLETRMQTGALSLPDYVARLRLRIRLDKQAAVASKAAGQRLSAVRLLGHVKLMTKELAEAEASLKESAPPPAAAGGKQYQSSTARSLQRMMAQFNAQVTQMDRTTQKQRCVSPSLRLCCLAHASNLHSGCCSWLLAALHTRCSREVEEELEQLWRAENS